MFWGKERHLEGSLSLVSLFSYLSMHVFTSAHIHWKKINSIDQGIYDTGIWIPFYFGFYLIEKTTITFLSNVCTCIIQLARHQARKFTFHNHPGQRNWSELLRGNNKGSNNISALIWHLLLLVIFHFPNCFLISFCVLL